MNTSPTHTVHDNSYRELKEAYEAERQQQQQPAPEPPQVQEQRREWIWRIGNNTIRAQLTSKTKRED
ncbi:hypothetical protein EXIGLDRAFT_716528 [Exidia glandulosa HHB12029]|uniref:Uncharacterized protein n=1 Tax=Exidia glandulosa HHB12029 TaxID=1314781 RepID=A0A165PAL2_EXIGL|nr:hypothetical protein EXIGLDRAFT_716528 [Exidia glandulosa HHB12029]